MDDVLDGGVCVGIGGLVEHPSGTQFRGQGFIAFPVLLPSHHRSLPLSPRLIFEHNANIKRRLGVRLGLQRQPCTVLADTCKPPSFQQARRSFRSPFNFASRTASRRVVFATTTPRWIREMWRTISNLAMVASKVHLLRPASRNYRHLSRGFARHKAPHFESLLLFTFLGSPSITTIPVSILFAFLLSLLLLVVVIAKANRVTSCSWSCSAILQIS